MQAAVARTHAALASLRQRLAARDDIVVSNQVAITEIPAPTGEESRRGDWIAARFASAGFRNVRRDAAGNVIACHPGAIPDETVVVCAHLDTVFPGDTALRVRRDGRRYVAPGIVDNGRGLAGMLALAEELTRARLGTARSIEFVATTGEEGAGNLSGAKQLFTSRPDRVCAVIAIDGAGDERIVHRALGSRRYRITYRGPGGHSWAAFGVPNAVHAAAIAGAALAAIRVPREPRTTLSVGRIGGGIAINAIPDEGWLEVDLRSVSPSALARIEAEMRVAVAAAAAEENARRAAGTPELTTQVVAIGDRPCGEVDADSALVRNAVAATQLVAREPELATASTDANVPIALGIPAIAIGAGGHGGDAHSTWEWFENVEGAVGIGRALTIVVHAAGLAA